MLVFFGFSVLPLDLTLSPVELYHKWTDGRIILMPFPAHKDGVAQTIYKYASDLIVWTPLGLLWSIQKPLSLGQIVLRGLLFGLLIEFFQLFVYSRVTNTTDVLMAGTGAALGFAIHKTAGAYAGSVTTLMLRHAKALYLGSVVLVLVVFWFPFNFEWGLFNGSAVWNVFSRPPLALYYFTSEWHATNELLRKVGFFLPLGATLALATNRGAVGRGGSVAEAWPVCLIALLVEAGQLMLPGKVADLTDVMLESLGGAIGYLVGNWLLMAGTEARSDQGRPMPAPGPATQAPATGTGMKTHLLWIAVLAAAIGALTSLPAMPYNVRYLIEPGLAGVVTVIGLTLAIYWNTSGALQLLARRKEVRGIYLAFPLALLMHAVVSWCILRVSTPNERFLKIVGMPILNWLWEFEALGRYVALHISVVTQLLGATLFVRAILQPRLLGYFVYWLLVSALLSWPLYVIVVEWAATDNLVELMRDNASFAAASCLAGFVFLSCLAAGATAAGAATGLRRLPLSLLALACSLGAAALLWQGLEPILVKYGKVFSALQFLLSTDRDHYAQGAALAWRYVIAFAGFVAAMTLLQWPYWRTHRPDFHGRGVG